MMIDYAHTNPRRPQATIAALEAERARQMMRRAEAIKGIVIAFAGAGLLLVGFAGGLGFCRLMG